MTEKEALELAISTWDEQITPVVHYSESREIHKGGDKPTPAHSDLVYGPIHTYGNKIDIMIEAKHKEQAIKTLKVKVRKEYLKVWGDKLEPLIVVMSSLIKVHEMNPPFKGVILERLLNDVYYPLSKGEKIQEDILLNSRFEIIR